MLNILRACQHSSNGSEGSEDMRRFWHFLFGHGGSYIEEHPFQLDGGSKGTLHICAKCDQQWFEWELCFVGDLLANMSISTDDLLKYVGISPPYRQRRHVRYARRR